MPPAQALSIAEEKGLDLVEIAATATPPVCRIMNSGKFFYQQAKRESEARKHQRHIQVKEVKFLEVEARRQFKSALERFLNDGNKVTATVISAPRDGITRSGAHPERCRLAYGVHSSKCLAFRKADMVPILAQ